MADPFSIIGLIGTAVDLGVRVAKLLSSFRGAKEACRKLKEEIAAVEETLKKMKARLERGADASKTLLHLMDEYRKTLEELEKELQKGAESSVRKLRWAFGREKRVNEFVKELERYQSHFSLALQLDIADKVDTVQLEISTDQKRAQRGESRREREDVVKWLEPVYGDKRLKISLEQRQPTTCEWILADERISAWRGADSGAFLWLHGIPGSGKTIIASVLIDHFLRTSTNDERVAYVFCDFRQPASTSPIRLFRTLLAQLLPSYREDFSVDFKTLIDDQRFGRSPPGTFSELVKWIKLAAKPLHRTLIIIDGIDECEKGKERESFLKLLPTLTRDSALSVLVASQIHADIRSAFQPATEISLREEHASVTRDILRHIQQEVERRDDLAVLGTDLKDNICSKLAQKADGMFRLVECQLDLLENEPTFGEIKDALDRLPETLFSTYDRILSDIAGISKRAPTIAKRALHWLLGASTPLRLSQIAEAIKIKPRSRDLDEGYGIPRKHHLLKILSSLVLHDRETDVVVLSHSSVQEYLISHDLREAAALSIYHIDMPGLNDRILALLLDYMLINAFDRLMLKNHDEITNFCNEEHPLFPFAASSWVVYLKAMDPNSEKPFDALCCFFLDDPVKRGNHKLRRQIRAYVREGFGDHCLPKKVEEAYHHPLLCLVLHDAPVLSIQRIMTQLPPQLPRERCLYWSLWGASSKRERQVTDLLLAAGGDVNAFYDQWPPTLLCNAMDSGNIDVAENLLDHGALVNAVGGGWTPLHFAVRTRSLEIVRRVLAMNKSALNMKERWHGNTPLAIANQMGLQAISDHLIAHGIASLFETGEDDEEYLVTCDIPLDDVTLEDDEQKQNQALEQVMQRVIQHVNLLLSDSQPSDVQLSVGSFQGKSRPEAPPDEEAVVLFRRRELRAPGSELRISEEHLVQDDRSPEYDILGDGLPSRNSPRDVKQVAHLLESKLQHGTHESKLHPREIVSFILDLAEYWSIFIAERTDNITVTQDTDDIPYLSLEIAGRKGSPLRLVIITTTSHDQGWSDNFPWDHGTYRSSSTWFDVANSGSHRRTVQRNINSSLERRTHRNVWDHIAPVHREWLETFEPGDLLQVYPKALFPAWMNYVYSVRIVAYTAYM
ncbi:hypothetical protein OF83DRAFT_1178084 [Amylostereum chailletii]|nr:hypothetical protein OF83DRAFT_1178084 [Amylostereum chailletii]